MTLNCCPTTNETSVKMAHTIFHLRLMQEWKRENQNENAQKMTLNCGPDANETSVKMAHTVFHLRLKQE